MKKYSLKITLIIITVSLLGVQSNAQDFKNLDKSPHDIAYYRANKISPPIIKALYGRPLKNGREVFGDLIPYDKIWRVGANEATEIRFYKDVIFGDKKVKSGTYVLYAIPGEIEWTLILSSNLDVWGTNDYKEKYDVARTKAKVARAEPLEAFSIGFKEKKKHINMTLGWDTTRIIIPIIVEQEQI